MTTPSPFYLAGVDPVGAATGWLAAENTPLAELIASMATGEGRHVGPDNAPPFPRLQITDSNADLRGFTGLHWVSLTIAVLGDPDGRPGKAVLRQLAVATVEWLHAMTEVPVVGGCVFTEVTGDGLAWSPLPPHNQPRYVVTSTLWSHPAPS